MTVKTISASQQRYLQRRTILLLSLAQIFSGIGTGAVVFTGSLLAVELSGSKALAGSVTTVMTLGAAFASVLLSRIALQRGRRVSLTSGLFVAAAGSGVIILAAVTGQFFLLILGGAMIGFGSAVNLQARFAATDLSQPEHHGRDLSLVVWMSTVGAVAGPNLTGAGNWFADLVGVPMLAGLFILSTLGMLTGMILIWVGLRPDPYLLSLELAGSGQGAKGGRQAGWMRQGWKSLMASNRAIAALVGILTAHAVMVAVMSMTPVHMTGHGAELTLVGFSVSLHIAGMYALAPVMGILSDKMGEKWVLAVGMVVLLVSVAFTGFSGDNHLAATIGLILLGLGWSAATVAGASLIVDAVPGEMRVSAQGLTDSLMSLAGGGGGAAAGVVMAVLGFGGLSAVSAVLVVVALVASWWLLSHPRERAEVELEDAPVE